MDWRGLLAYAGAWALLAMLPGPDTALTLKHAMVDGRASAVRTAAGSCTALAVHVTMVALGLSALLARSEAAFTVVKLAGAAYLAYLGVRMILAAPRRPDEASPVASPSDSAAPLPVRTPDSGPASARRRPRRSPYAQGILTGLLNPKSALFFITFLPQFVNPSAPPVPTFAALVGITVLVAAAWFAVIVLIAGRARAMIARPRLQAIFQRATGSVFVVIAGRLATATHR
jgi:threonine/homoserine/homoserine lactone efflux protein